MPPIVAASSRVRSIFRSLGKTANLAGGVVRTHWNGLAHGKPPQFAILNHTAIDSGIPRESAPQRLGITRRRLGECVAFLPRAFRLAKSAGRPISAVLRRGADHRRHVHKACGGGGPFLALLL